MPIRIYALAQELKLDSKELVDVCVKAGVVGKGSALASLTDEELARVKEYLGAPKGGGRISAPATPSEVRSATPPSERVMTRDDYVGPHGGSGKPPTLDAGSRKKPEPKRPVEADRGKPPVRREPVVKLAAIPPTSQSAMEAPAAPPEPVAQKPIMTLPKEAIRGAQQGIAAPLQQFTRQQDKKRRPAEPPREASPPDTPVVAEFPPEEGRAKDARGRRRPVKFEKDRVEDPEVEREMAGMASARANRQQTRKPRPATADGEDETTATSTASRRKPIRPPRNMSKSPSERGPVAIEFPCTIRIFSEATGLPAMTVVRNLMTLGMPVANINSTMTAEVAEMIALEAGIELEARRQQTVEDQVLATLDALDEDPDQMEVRPPVVTFLGHVDHGKTSLLDRIIGINVVSKEAGGITQHIRAYQVTKGERKISFVDTPGHEAFTEMRARGANVTDIAVLVIAADDGFMPQTEEALSHARAAKVPIVVALNKTDLPGIDVNRVMQEMAAHELLPTEWGGDTEVIKTSAVTGAGIDELLETLLLTAELHEYKANPHRPARGTCLEAQQEGARGVVAKVIVKNGTLRVGDIIVCGAAHGRVKAMYDPLQGHKRIAEAGPSTPVNLTGLDIAPDAGDPFLVLQDIAVAREIAGERARRSRHRTLAGQVSRVSFEEFQRRLEDGRLGASDEVSELNLILRADVRGSVEAIQKELGKFDHPEVQIRVLQATVGGITVADVTLADASDAVIVGFNVIPDENARALADERGVEIRRYDIIYKLTEDIKKMIEGKLKPEEQVQELGRALVQRVFLISKVGAVAGCRVLAGTIERGSRIRVNRDGRGIGDYALESLRRERDDAKEVREGYECGMKLAGFNDLKEGDILEAYKILEVARTLN